MRKLSLLALVLGLAACRGGDGDDGDDTPNPDGSVNASDVTIQEIQNDAMPSGTAVALKGVVVTALDAFGDRTGDLFVSEPEGGAYSGVKVFNAPLDQISGLVPGDIVDITGAIKHEGCTQASPCGPVVFDDGASITEIMPATTGSMTIKKVGTGPVPTPVTVDAKQMATLPVAERIAEWEKYEGVLMKVINARQLAAVRPFGSSGGVDSTEFRITGVARVQSTLTELPETAVAGVCYDSITGVGDFFFNYIIAPRSAADLVGGGTGCNPMVESIAALQSASTPPELVKLTDVYVSAVANNKKNFWVSSSLTAAPNEGVYVFRGTGTSTTELPANVVAGAKVTVYGEGTEFDGNNGGETLTQVTSPSITVTAPPTGQVAPVTDQTVTDLLDPATGEDYEGVLVTLTNVKVTTLGTAPNHVSDLAQFPGNVAFKADDDLGRFVAADACYASITGIWTYNAFDDRYVFLPNAAGTGTGTCD